MATDAAQLDTIKTQTLALIVDLTENPKPSYMVDGQSIQWSAYMNMLKSTIDWVNKQIAAETPFEVISQGFT